MSTRSVRKKKAPVRALELEEETSPHVSRGSSRKSKGGKERSLTPASRNSSPDSRGSSPAVARSKSMKNSSVNSRKGSKSSNSLSKGGSRASSVSSGSKGSKSKGKSPAKPKLKTKLGRGYNPNLVNYKDSEYHYGSDFEGEDEYEEAVSEKSSETEDSEADNDDSDDMKPESDVELEPILSDRDSFTPVPYWLQDYAEIPSLTLPPSSDDLLVDPDVALSVVSVYEVLRQFRVLIRLSPFRLEEFCAALASDEQSQLVSEVHIALLKCLLREDEVQQIQYGPLDQKDSVNILLHCYDNVTWPENLRFYLTNDLVANQIPLEILNTTEYPFTSLTNKLAVLRHLTDAVLAGTAVRDDLINEGSLPLEDHCRVCHRLGDMVVCEHCNGPFHGTCLVPPLLSVPEEEWICPVCAKHMVDGVFDCVVIGAGEARHQVLGVDRQGSRYWFMARRLWVEDLQGGARYYSSKEQLEEVLESLDRGMYERELVLALEEKREEMEEHMGVTSRLTEEMRGDRESYLEMENKAWQQVQEARREVREKEELERKSAQEQVDKVIREEEENRRKREEDEKREEAARRRKVREERMEERMKKRGDAFEDLGLFEDDDPILEEVNTTDENLEEVTETVSTAPSDSMFTAIPQPSRRTPVLIAKPDIPPGSYYKLGEEGTFRQYSNQYTLVTHALSKTQVKEEQDRRMRLSHKFSLTEESFFSWQGKEMGSRAVIVATIRSTILHLEQKIPSCFMHANWTMLKKPWMNAVQASSNAGKDFSRALTVLLCCLKPCILLPVWTDSLGHTNIKRISALAKEEKKKAEKKEKKEKEEEEERLKPWMTWVKYTLPVKSLTVVRQKGEEYRAHGRNGWLWLRNTRVFKPQDSSKLGLKAGPHRVAVKYTELKTNKTKVVLMDPKAFNFLMKVQKERDDKALARMVSGEDSVDDVDKMLRKEKSEEEKKRDNLTKILDMSRIDMQEPSDEDMGGSEGVIDVGLGLVNPTRLLYPKSAKKTSLDEFLARRIQLKTWEERRVQQEASKNSDSNSEVPDGEKDSKTVITSDMVGSKATDSGNLEIWMSSSKRKLFDAVKVVKDSMASLEPVPICYSSSCQAGDPTSCYSPNCEARSQHEALRTATEIYRQVSKEGKMKEVLNNNIEEEFVFADSAAAITALQNTVKQLLVKEKELPEQEINAIPTEAKPSLDSNLPIKTEDVKTETEDVGKPVNATSSFEAKSMRSEEKTGIKLCYSVESTEGSLYLKRIQSVADSKKTSRIVKYPLAPSFWSQRSQERSIMIINSHHLKKLARNFGQNNADGFNYAAKANNSVWPYPCPRPLFRTTWLFRTSGMSSLASVAMQLRILWMCIRWDDMAAKPSTQDGKTQQTFDTEIVTTEILKHRNVGRYLEQTQYFMRKISIPLDQPRKQVDYSPIRSGLRKRKRAESPVSADPKVEEVWITEGELEPCDIRAYRERIEREKSATLTRRAAGTTIKAPEKYDPSEMERTKKVLGGSSSLQEIKQKTEDSLREQRAAFKAGRSSTPELHKSGNIPQLQVRRSGEAGGIRLVADNKALPTSTPNTAKKIFISKDGKIIGHQISGGANVSSAPPGKVAIPSLSSSKQSVVGGNTTPAAGTQQKVQIVKSADGKIQVRGLLPGQQLVQMPDGKLQIFSNQPASGAGSPAKAPGTKVLGGAGVITQSPVASAGSSVSTSPVKPQTQPSLLPKPSPAQSSVSSSSKTYTIQRNPNLIGQQPSSVTPIQPKLPAIQPQPSSAIQPSPSIQLSPSIQPSPAIQPSPVVQPSHNVQPVPQPSLTSPPAPAQAGTIGLATPGKQNMVVGIQSLGANTVTIKDGQLIVQGPDHAAATAIAKQLSSGQAKLANLGGKQVLLTTAPAASEPTPAPPPKEPTPPPPPPPKEPTPPPPPAPLTVTAQLVQTAEGPRIILQGLQGVQLEQQQLVSIQQQVKQQLLRQQALARQQGKVPPTKVSIQLAGNLPRGPVNPPTEQLPDTSSSVGHDQQPVDQGVHHQPPPSPVTQPAAPLPSHSLETPPAPQTPPRPGPSLPLSPPQAGNATLASLPQSVIKQGHFVIKDGKKVLVLPQNVLAEHQAKLAAQQSTPQNVNTPQQQSSNSLLLSSLTNSPEAGLTSPRRQQASLTSPDLQHPNLENSDKFELTEDYIQQTIKNALKTGNLTPELQEKLMSQLDGGEMPDITKKIGNPKKGKKSPSTKAVIDPVSGEPMDEEWQPLNWQRNKINNSPTVVEKKKSEADTDEDCESTVNFPKSPPIRAPIKKLGLIDDKKRISVQNRLSSMLFKQKEQLKKDIAKKRAVLEKELSLEISKEVDSLKQQAQIKLNSQKNLTRKRSTSDFQSPPPTSNNATTPPSKKRRKSEKAGQPASQEKANLNDSSDNIPGIKKDRMYCICKSKYDSTKFYVGCDICSNWFHGACVGITPKMSKKMSEYVCDECRSAKENDEIYCLCRQPYDESQFYIGCESCTDWFHGRCVGIIQAESDSIDEYVCPKCAPNSKYNYANLKKLNSKDHELIKKTFKAIQQNRNSQPFKEPEDPNVNPKYYEIVKEPMDLHTIELRVNHCQYSCLAEFIGDVTRIFENCRYFNPHGTGVAESAEKLEAFLATKIVSVREKVTQNK